MANFKNGEKVVCVHQSKRTPMDYRHNHVFPKKDSIYTVRNFQDFPDEKDLYLRFEECVNPLLPILDGRRLEICFSPKNFRKLDYQFADEVLEKLKEFNDLIQKQPPVSWNAGKFRTTLKQ